jgi:hypothetical protein
MSKKKDFDGINRKYMHPTRRKLAEMVFTGEYESNTTIGYTPETKTKRKEGETWEDEHSKYEQKQGFYVKSSKNSDVYKDIRDYVRKYDDCKNPDCQTITVSTKDKKFIKKNGYCMNCTVDIEHNFRAVGIWKEYEIYKLATRMIIDGKFKIEQLQQAHDEAKQVHEFVNEDGTTDKWTMPQDVEDVKADILKLIETGRGEIKQLEEQRDATFKIIKEHNLEHYL